MSVSVRMLASLLVLALLSTTATVQAKPPWGSLIPFTRVEADPNVSYELSENHGPWMILVSSFAGPGAEQQAHKLVLELRREFRLPAYIHRKSYDYSQPVTGLGLNRYGEPKKMRYRHAGKFDEYAVLVGDFDSFENPQVAKTLQRIKYAHPACLDFKQNKQTAQRLVLLREIHRRITNDEDKRSQGPMGSAFVTRNPLLPEEYFRDGKLDELVLQMNQEVEFSLLDNPGKYTVRVATFRGQETMNLEEIERLQDNSGGSTKLAEAADRAHRVAMGLRRRGVEAYEFHDRHESIVTIGSFESLGRTLDNGSLELNPAVHKVMKDFSARQEVLPGGGAAGLVPVNVDGVPLDVQPLPIEVPRQSVSTALRAARR
ncbi:MAG: hypothetical protein J5I93_03220 [Pirellulaceae bacterium]|nr:hypothetical protein [Pirellulaceae bacterium]